VSRNPGQHQLDTNDKWIKGLGESVIMKMLAIVEPERYLPVFPYTGENGKARLLKALDMPLPPSDLSAGHRQIESNDALRARLEPLLPGDPWAQAQFLYWFVEQPEEVAISDVDAVGALAEELLVDRTFIEEIQELLEVKKQVVFYGPPGTGKTFVARALAGLLAPDPTRRVVVQFHPSTSYEDFFEGYRPEESAGQLSYTLRKGPLAMMAELAEASPGVKHVMVIDEINRANLPKVFGELLYLLEYRGDEVSTLYRPEDKFTLPANLYFIGTMNTADRSIALVDAALRRRFHFVPFFPDDGPMAGLLAKWLERNNEPAWVAALLETVNVDLTSDLGGPDLQIGPSYFMRKGVEAALPRIWKYNIEPLIADQLFGREAKIKEYRFEAVMARFRQQVGVAASAADVELVDAALPGDAAAPEAQTAPAAEG
jgi:5-methylcytosine-specific restriction protein B